MTRHWEQPDYEERASYRFGPSLRSAPVVMWLLIINAAVFVVEFLLYGHDIWQTIFLPLMLSPTAVFEQGCLWQLITYSFLHDAGGFLHVLMNLLFLYWFGTELEETWGSRRFLVFYLMAALFAGLCFCAVHYLLRNVSFCFGASGAIMALLMAYALHWPRRTIWVMFVLPVPVWVFVLFVVVIEALTATRTVMQGFSDNGTANLAHLGGLLYGYLYVRGAPWVEGLRQRFRWDPSVHGEADDRRLDEILAKVHRDGMQSLTWRERRFLRKMSQRR